MNSVVSDENISVTKLDIEGKNIYVKIIWLKTEEIVFRIQIFDDDKSWSGCFTTENAEECRINAVENEEEYYKNVRTCLTNTCDMYFYEFTYASGDTNIATFKWKKNFEGTTRLIHGSVELRRDVNTDSKNMIIDILLNKNMLQEKDMKNSHKVIQELRLEIDNLKTELTKFVAIKDSLEDTLYGKFVSLLNNKKKRIQVLEDHLQNYGSK